MKRFMEIVILAADSSLRLYTSGWQAVGHSALFIGPRNNHYCGPFGKQELQS